MFDAECQLAQFVLSQSTTWNAFTQKTFNPPLAFLFLSFSLISSFLAVQN